VLTGADTAREAAVELTAMLACAGRAASPPPDLTAKRAAAAAAADISARQSAQRGVCNDYISVFGKLEVIVAV